MEAMYKMADREIKAGRLLDHGGLMPAASGAEVRIKDGLLSVVDGLYQRNYEIVGHGPDRGLGRWSARQYYVSCFANRGRRRISDKRRDRAFDDQPAERGLA